MKEILAAVLIENEAGNLSVAFHLNDPKDLTARVDKMLPALLQARATMQPPVQPQAIQDGQQLQPVVGSGWHVHPTLGGDLAVSLHHPALGWLTWQMPAEMARELIAGMVTVLDQEAKPPSHLQ